MTTPEWGATPALLVLDNFEHLVDAGADVVTALLEHAPDLTCLVTSRRVLGLDGEREFPVGPLPVPETVARPVSDEELLAVARCPSVRLFVDRAQAARPEFQITAANATALVALCRRLEGIPLAMELAAGRTRVMAPSQMLAHFEGVAWGGAAAPGESPLKLLASRRRGTPARHQSLWSALDWSYRLLSPELQRFFCRLWVFRGGWTLEAAAAVCDVISPLDSLEALQECSLVQTAGGPDGEIRFRMLETLREFGAEQLTAPEREDLERRHAAFFLDLVARAAPELTRANQLEWVERLQQERENLRAALAGCEQRGESEAGLQMAGSLWRFWWLEASLSEGRDWIERMARVAGIERTATWARAQARAATLALFQAEHTACERLSLEALEVARSLDDPPGIACAFHNLGWQAMRRGDLAAARALHRESLALRREIDDPWEIAFSMSWLGHVATESGETEESRQLHEESLSIWSEMEDRMGMGIACNCLAGVALNEERYPEARRLAGQAVTLARELGAIRILAWALDLLGHAHYRMGEMSGARQAYEESLWFRREQSHEVEIAHSLCYLGKVALQEEDAEQARARYAEALVLRRRQEDLRGIIACLEGLGLAAELRGDLRRAGRLFGAAAARVDALRSQVESTWGGLRWNREWFDEDWRAAVRTRHAGTAFDAGWVEGERLSLEEAIAEALKPE